MRLIILLRVMRTTAAAAGALWAALSLGVLGCGDDEPEPISGPAKEVAGVVQTFERALRARDYERICRRLYARATARAAGGKRCAARQRKLARRLRDPRIRVESITIRGNAAAVDVVTTARKQPEVREKMQLVRERGRYRIASLGEPGD
jgi:hypothetical protein